MIFGEKVPARTMRQSEGAGTPTPHLPNPPAIPYFTVRRFAGTILNAVKPFYGLDKMFGQDVYQLRLVFADWPQGTTEDFPVEQGDFLVIPTGTDANGAPIYERYEIRGQDSWPGSHIEIYVGVAPKG